MQNDNKISFTKVNHDINGNPRYVTHFPNLLIEGDLFSYNNALYNARKCGGTKYRAKWYGGGILFSTYSLDSLVQDINRVTGKNFTGYTCD